MMYFHQNLPLQPFNNSLYCFHIIKISLYSKFFSKIKKYLILINNFPSTLLGPNTIHIQKLCHLKIFYLKIFNLNTSSYKMLITIQNQWRSYCGAVAPDARIIRGCKIRKGEIKTFV